MSLSPAAPYDDASAPADDDFDSIEAAVLETPRGRWFLREFARRLKSAESDRVFEALARIERLIEESNAVARQPAPARPAPESPGQVADLRFAVRLVQLRLMDMAASMRAGGVDERFCEQVEQQARAFVEIASGRAPQAHAAPPAAPRPAAPPA
ncbi:MAG: hypothetical protein JWN93_2587, partial [Hyphomicrobiales bacterium]|nr:hypothetical protein [Hyphomicrobiales bacterium]